ADSRGVDHVPPRGATRGRATSNRCASSARLLALLAAFLPAACGDSGAGPAPEAYTDEEIAYLSELAFGSEFGEGGARLRRWPGEVPIAVHGTPTDTDRTTLTAVIEEINTLTGSDRLALTEGEAAVDIYFVPESEFEQYEPNYRSTNYGFFWTWWNESHQIVRARILISTEEVTQTERSHLIREELTQSLGLMRDSRRYPESIFYSDWTTTTEYAAIDRVVIEMLYRPELEPGMTVTQVVDVLERLTRSGRVSSRVPAVWAPSGPPRSDRGGSAGGGSTDPHRAGARDSGA
ncbi:MAG: DUF2927 domain-containing protein, partial [Gemmatimonadota bacterium]